MKAFAALVLLLFCTFVSEAQKSVVLFPASKEVELFGGTVAGTFDPGDTVSASLGFKNDLWAMRYDADSTSPHLLRAVRVGEVFFLSVSEDTMYRGTVTAFDKKGLHVSFEFLPPYAASAVRPSQVLLLLERGRARVDSIAAAQHQKEAYEKAAMAPQVQAGAPPVSRARSVAMNPDGYIGSVAFTIRGQQTFPQGRFADYMPKPFMVQSQFIYPASPSLTSVLNIEHLSAAGGEMWNVGVEFRMYLVGGR